MNRVISFPGLVMVLAISMFLSDPAFAQMDISGQWGPVFDEDRDERAGGPELGEYMGMPADGVSRSVTSENISASMVFSARWPAWRISSLRTCIRRNSSVEYMTP